MVLIATRTFEQSQCILGMMMIEHGFSLSMEKNEVDTLTLTVVLIKVGEIMVLSKPVV